MKIIKQPKFGKELELVPFRVDKGSVFVKFYEDGVQAGFPSPAEDFKELKLSLDERYLQNPDTTFIVKVKGNSMFPVFHGEDLLIVKSDVEFEDNSLGVVSVNHTEFTVKRLDKKNNALVPENKDYPIIKVEGDDVVLCLGVVKHLIRDL